jgi:hypothetical protein
MILQLSSVESTVIYLLLFTQLVNFLCQKHLAKIQFSHYLVVF